MISPKSVRIHLARSGTSADVGRGQNNRDEIVVSEVRTDVEELLDGSGVAEFVGHHGDVVESIKVGERLGVGLVFDQFLRSPVEESNMGIRSQDLLSVELEDQSEHSVRGGVLRSASCHRISNLPSCAPCASQRAPRDTVRTQS